MIWQALMHGFTRPEAQGTIILGVWAESHIISFPINHFLCTLEAADGKKEICKVAQQWAGP